MTRDELQSIIREEIISVLREYVNKKHEKNADSVDDNIDEEKKPSKKKGTDSRGTYTSAGTLPGSKGDANPPSQQVSAEKRKSIGTKLLNTYARGDVSGKGKGKGKKSTEASNLRKSVKDAAKERFDTESPTKKQVNSVIWSIATKKAQADKKK